MIHEWVDERDGSSLNGARCLDGTPCSAQGYRCPVNLGTRVVRFRCQHTLERESRRMVVDLAMMQLLAKADQWHKG